MMSTQELFYGKSEPAYFAHYGRPSSALDPVAPSSMRRRRTNLVTFDLLVPICCRMCEAEVRDALLALSSVASVACNPYNQRVTVTGYLDPAEALHQLDSSAAQNGYTSYSTHRSKAPSHQVKPQYPPHAQLGNSPYPTLSDTMETKKLSANSHRDRDPNRLSRSSKYFCTSCPGGNRESAVTHVVSLNNAIATRVQMAC